MGNQAPGDPSGTEDGVLWGRVGRLVDEANSVEALRHHGLELIAARHWRKLDRPVPEELRADERLAAIRALAAPVLLSRVRDAYDGTLVLMKGPEVAAHYPDPRVRTYCDLDFLVDRPEPAHRALLRAGFVEVGDPAHYHGAVPHLRPLMWPTLPLSIELHRQVNRPPWLSPPPTAELLELTTSSSTGVADILAPVPAVHAILVALHGWAHQPLRRLLDLIDVAVVIGDGDRDAAAEFARRWGLQRLWRTTIAAVDGLLGDGRIGVALGVWARHLSAVRERTVLETHLTRWAGPVWSLPDTRLRALGGATAMFTEAARPRAGEAWPDAIRRTALAIGDSRRPQSQHELMKETRIGR